MPQHLAMVLADLARGGIGKIRLHLANEFLRRGILVDLLLARTDSPYLTLIDPRVRIIDLGAPHFLSGLSCLAFHLRWKNPDVLLTRHIRDVELQP